MVAKKTYRRRTVVRTGAWAVPVIATAAAAPAFAASSCTGASCPDLSFGAVDLTSGSLNGTTNGPLTYTRSGAWTFTANGTGWSTNNTNPVGFVPAPLTGALSGKGTLFSATGEPTSAGRVLTLTQAGQPPLRAGCSYVLRIGVSYYTSSGSVDLVLNAYAGNTVIATYTTLGKGPNGQGVDAGIQTFPVTPNVTGAVSFRFLFGAAAGTNDLTVYQPSVLCS